MKYSLIFGNGINIMFNRIKHLFNRVFKKKQQYNIEGSLNQLAGPYYKSTFTNSFTAPRFYQICGETYNKNNDLQEAISKIVTACCEFNLVFKKHGGDEEDVPTIIMEWLQNISTDYCTYKQFIKSAFIQYFVGGEVFYLKDEERKKVTLVKPNEVLEIKVIDNFPYFYKLSHSFFHRTKLMKYSDVESYFFETVIKDGRPRNEIVHWFNRNPIIDWRGLSPVVMLLNDIEILYKGRHWNKNVLQNEGRPSGVLFHPPKSMGAIEGADNTGDLKGMANVEDQLQQVYAGDHNAGKALVLKGGLQFKEITYKMKDVDFLQGLKFSRESLANMFGIPLQMFGSENKSTYNNMREARTSFYLDTCVPFFNQYLMFLSNEVMCDFFPEYKGYYLCVDEKKIQQSSDRYMETMEKLDKIQFLTINEKREKLGLKPLKLENTDTLLVSSNLGEIEDLGNEPMEDGDNMFNDDNEEDDKPPKNDKPKDNKPKKDKDEKK